MSTYFDVCMCVSVYELSFDQRFLHKGTSVIGGYQLSIPFALVKYINMLVACIMLMQ